MNSSTRFLLLAASLLLASCTTGVSDSSGSGGDSDITVQFSTTSTTRTEATEMLQVFLELNKDSNEDIDLNFTWNGTATEFVDYTVPNGTPVTIPAGQVTHSISLLMIDDVAGELDEFIQLKLVPPVNANLGARTVHVVTVLDDDALPFPEVEPNDDPAGANVVGTTAPGLAYEVSGATLVNFFDFFKFDGIVDSEVHVSLDPSSAVAQVVLNVLDENGVVVDVIDDDQPGTTIGTVFDVAAGQTFYLGVTVEGAGTDYVLDVIAISQ
jgi:hypothetical protein